MSRGLNLKAVFYNDTINVHDYSKLISIYPSNKAYTFLSKIKELNGANFQKQENFTKFRQKFIKQPFLIRPLNLNNC